ELHGASADEIQKKVEAKLQYDEYAWQKERNVRIKEKNRACGLHLPLYQCISCKTKGRMRSGGEYLWCEACGKKWILMENGDLEAVADGSRKEVPAWYRWERQQVERQIRDGVYPGCDILVRIDALPNE
ncbi:hypothetical protein RCJ22_39110, partial [Vibrio sp. FNV 38]|nr:hypothetical protein [Vibrio sp. FNV 38]